MIGTTLNFKPSRSFKFTKTDLIVLFVLLSFLVGYTIGISLICRDNSVICNFAQRMFQKMNSIQNGSTFWYRTLMAIISFCPYIVIAYMFGTSILGCAVLPSVCTTKGFFDGILVAYIYQNYSLSGMGYTVLILAPFLVLSTFLLILACRESVCFSSRILMNTLPRGTSYNLSGDFKLYSFRYIFLLILSIVVSIFNSILSAIFVSYFNF